MKMVNRNGQGTETFPDGDKYVGGFKDGGSVSNAISRVKRRLRNNKFKKRYRQIFDSL